MESLTLRPWYHVVMDEVTLRSSLSSRSRCFDRDRPSGYLIIASVNWKSLFLPELDTKPNLP